MAMYLGVDVGGSKTLAAVLDAHGVIKQHVKFPTPQRYTDFLRQLHEAVDSFTTKEFVAAGLGMPATELDRAEGIGRTFANLDWHNVPIQHDLEQLAKCPVVVENDAKLAALSEAMLRPPHCKLLYVTVSTGIGYALVVDRIIDPNLGDGGGRLMNQAYRGKTVPWESFASGRAIVDRYHKLAQDITDKATWQRIAHDLAGGFLELIAVTEPDVIVVGGSVGSYFERLEPHLAHELAARQTPLLHIPPLEKAKRPEQAVVYGCYDLAKVTYG